MSGPKHLWSGDWERESSEATRRRARPPAPPEPTGTPPEPPPERARARTRRRRRLGAAVATLVVGIGGVAYAASAIGGSHHKRSAALGETGTAPVTVPAPTPRFSVPTTPTIPTTPATTPTVPTTPTTATPTTPGLAGSALPIEWLGMEIVAGAGGQAVVDTVDTNSAGGQAGLDPGDVIEGIAGRTVAGPHSIVRALTGLHAGLRVPIEVVRGSNFLILEITLGAPPSRYP